MQDMPLDIKVKLTRNRIRAWYEYWGGNVYVSFSGGKDSTVLIHLVREMYPDVIAVFVNTGLEYLEIQSFVKTFDNVRILYPKKSFFQVISEYGYPVLSKEICHKIEYARKGSDWALKFVNGKALDENGKPSRYNINKYKPLLETDFLVSSVCCDIMKKAPAHEFERKTKLKRMTAQMACESTMRTQQWLFNGCNGFDMKSPVSNPMAFWTEQDVLAYIAQNGIEIANVYGNVEFESNQILLDGFSCKYKTIGCNRTGCLFCGFGVHLEKESRFQRLKQTHPRQYEFCIYGGEYSPEGFWQPNKNGLGMGHVFSELNHIYGDNFISF